MVNFLFLVNKSYFYHVFLPNLVKDFFTFLIKIPYFCIRTPNIELMWRKIVLTDISLKYASDSNNASMYNSLDIPYRNHIVRQSNVIFSPNPALTVTVFFPLDYTSLGCLEWISSGYQEDILEKFEKSKMAAKMAAIAKKKLNHLILFIKSRVISLFPLNVI